MSNVGIAFLEVFVKITRSLTASGNQVSVLGELNQLHLRHDRRPHTEGNLWLHPEINLCCWVR
jgi:hypothetical protein